MISLLYSISCDLARKSKLSQTISMKEIEIKILEVDVDDLITRLLDFGARQVFDGQMNVKFYDFTDRRLKKEKKFARLRQVGDEVEFTVKQKISQDQAKIVNEYEVNVSDFAQMHTILTQMGLEVHRHYRKHRTSYIIERVRFELDTIENTPTLLEIEAPSIEELYRWVEKLGYPQEKALPWSGSDVLKHYGKL